METTDDVQKRIYKLATFVDIVATKLFAVATESSGEAKHSNRSRYVNLAMPEQ